MASGCHIGQGKHITFSSQISFCLFVCFVFDNGILHRGFPGGSGVKNLPAKQETWVPSLAREDPLEKEMVTHPSILAWEIPLSLGCWCATFHEVKKSQTQLSD